MDKILKHAVQLDADTIASLRQAIERGKYSDGRRLTEDEVAMCIQVVIAWEHAHLMPDQRTAFIDRGSKKEDEHCASSQGDTPTDGQPVRWQ